MDDLRYFPHTLRTYGSICTAWPGSALKWPAPMLALVPLWACGGVGSWTQRPGRKCDGEEGCSEDEDA